MGLIQLPNFDVKIHKAESSCARLFNGKTRMKIQVLQLHNCYFLSVRVLSSLRFIISTNSI